MLDTNVFLFYLCLLPFQHQPAVCCTYYGFRRMALPLRKDMGMHSMTRQLSHTGALKCLPGLPRGSCCHQNDLRIDPCPHLLRNIRTRSASQSSPIIRSGSRFQLGELPCLHRCCVSPMFGRLMTWSTGSKALHLSLSRSTSTLVLPT